MKDSLIIALLALTAALVFFALFPRYEWNVEQQGTSLIVFDRWQGRFQRAAFQEDGTLRSWDVFTPF